MYYNYEQDKYVPVNLYKNYKRKRNNWRLLFLILLGLDLFSYLYILSCFNIDSTGTYFTWGEATYEIERI